MFSSFEHFKYVTSANQVDTLHRNGWLAAEWPPVGPHGRDQITARYLGETQTTLLTAHNGPSHDLQQHHARTHQAARERGHHVLRPHPRRATHRRQQRVRYAGGPYDATTGATKFGARYYDPNTGRFTQPDPSGQEHNPYAYAGNNPATWSDPTGLCGEWYSIEDCDLSTIRPSAISGMAQSPGRLKVELLVRSSGAVSVQCWRALAVYPSPVSTQLWAGYGGPRQALWSYPGVMNE